MDNRVGLDVMEKVQPRKHIDAHALDKTHRERVARVDPCLEVPFVHVLGYQDPSIR